jgi:hypothetical protein
MYDAKYLEPRPRTGADTILHLKPWAGLTSPVKLFDYSLNGHIGTVTGTSPSFKYPGIDLPGTNEHIVVADHADFTPALTPLSIRIWVYMHDATNFILASKGLYNTDGEWLFALSGSDTLFFNVYDESVDNCRIGRLTSSTLTSYENTWVRLVVTYNGGTLSSGVKLYLNAAQIDDGNFQTNAGSFVSVENLDHDVWIGRSNTVYANGLIDELMIDKKELSATEIRSDYEVTRSRYGV